MTPRAAPIPQAAGIASNGAGPASAATPPGTQLLPAPQGGQEPHPGVGPPATGSRASVLAMSVGAAAAGRSYTHELLDDIPPVSGLKEKLSIAVIEMLASSAGLDVGRWGMDYDGRDVTLSSSHDYSPHTYGPSLDLQMKCTGQERALRDDHVAWQLDARTSLLLSAPNRQSMAALCVVVVPEHPGHWLDWPDEGLLAYCRPYFLGQVLGSGVAVRRDPGVVQAVRARGGSVTSWSSGTRLRRALARSSRPR